MERYTLGVSSCLLGNRVRYNGADKLEPFITEFLSKWFDMKPICPENDAGLPIPRDPINLIKDGESYDLVNIHSGESVKDRVLEWFEDYSKVLDKGKVDGFILKSKSPSCGAGLFTILVKERYPNIPLIDEKGLNHIDSREIFIRSLFVLREWRGVLRDPGNIYTFHDKYRNLFMTLNTLRATVMDQLLNRRIYLRHRVELYNRQLSRLLLCRQREYLVYKVLKRMFNRVKEELSREDRYELIRTIELYKQKQVPLLEPVTLMKHYIKKSNSIGLYEDRLLNPPYPFVNLLYHV